MDLLRDSLLELLFELLELLLGDGGLAERAHIVLAHPAFNAVGVEVVSDVAREGCDHVGLSEGHEADGAVLAQSVASVLLDGGLEEAGDDVVLDLLLLLLLPPLLAEGHNDAGRAAHQQARQECQQDRIEDAHDHDAPVVDEVDVEGLKAGCRPCLEQNHQGPNVKDPIRNEVVQVRHYPYILNVALGLKEQSDDPDQRGGHQHPGDEELADCEGVLQGAGLLYVREVQTDPQVDPHHYAESHLLADIFLELGDGFVHLEQVLPSE
eukprot:CAMPEP_0170541842 /NCGR_PEP_ID=MMETSP0211-20121228/1459_1 /TAXON_ID=311385 /ORGANISM="Pseudokeronopsis sp., Strain OXSARD2" /LENGTH=265 /DNA_ID=CAMNT_0010844717 /DNA_START=63 /DNA_END=860 /DNA_ORIENTATION=-